MSGLDRAYLHGFSAEDAWLPVWEDVALDYIPCPFWFLLIKILFSFHCFDVVIVSFSNYRKVIG